MCGYAGCHVLAEPGEKLCILHLARPKDAGQFRTALYLQLDEMGSEGSRNPRYNFVGYRFPCGIVVGLGLRREDTLDVILPETIDRTIHFAYAEVMGTFFCYGARFEGDVDFTHAEIGGSVSFLNVTIAGAALFEEARIEGDVVFGLAGITGSVDFCNAKIKRHAFFNHAVIEGDAAFYGATIGGTAGFADTEILGKTRFEACSARSVFLGQEKPRLRGWRLGRDRCGVVLRDASTASSFWRFAQLAFAKTGDREAADAAFYFDRVWRWKASRTSTRFWIIHASRGQMARMAVVRAIYRVLWVLDCVFIRWTTAYGASISRLFATWFIVIGGFGIAFSVNPRLLDRAGAHVWTLDNWITSIHYSVTTFTTLGLGDLKPGASRLGMVLTSTEALLGAVLIALAVLVIGRRFMRQ